MLVQPKVQSNSFKLASEIKNKYNKTTLLWVDTPSQQAQENFKVDFERVITYMHHLITTSLWESRDNVHKKGSVTWFK